MVTRIDEVIKAKSIIAEEMNNLTCDGKNLEIGCMIETPASAFMLEDLLELTDFISIGSNDLIQYSLAVDRMNDNVADRAVVSTDKGKGPGTGRMGNNVPDDTAMNHGRHQLVRVPGGNVA